MSAHSSGPWAIREWNSYGKDGALDACGQWVVDATGSSIQVLTGESASEQEDADMRLVAAAPTLLMALDFLIEQCEGFNVSGVYFNEFRENRDALDTAYDAIELTKRAAQVANKPSATQTSLN
jgi:hypothetical protein